MGLLGKLFGKKGGKPSAGQGLREKMLSSTAEVMGETPTEEFPKVFAVVADMPMTGIETSIFASCHGDGSLYTSSTFGIIGGVARENVRESAIEFCKVANEFYDSATPAIDHAFAPTGFARFYLLGFDGLRYVEAPMNDIMARQHPCAILFALAQNVMAQLRISSGG